MGRVVHYISNTVNAYYLNSLWSCKHGKKMPPNPQTSLVFSSRVDPSSQPDSTPDPNGSGTEELWLSSPHHTVTSLLSRCCECSSMSFSKCFFLQYLTATMIPRRIRIAPQAPPTDAARMLISERVAANDKTQNMCLQQVTFECCLSGNLRWIPME